MDRLPAHRRARLGLARTFQSPELFADLTVRENLLAAARGTARSDVDRVLSMLDLVDIAGHRPNELSMGQRKLVSVARGLAMHPVLLLLDEPAAGLDDRETADFARRLGTIRDLGISILLVDHDMSLVMSVCEQIHVLEFGRLIASGTADEIQNDAHVIAAYLGSRNAPHEADRPA
jgi:branched-chain amino acid transport system ATP-binding protein